MKKCLAFLSIAFIGCTPSTPKEDLTQKYSDTREKLEVCESKVSQLETQVAAQVAQSVTPPEPEAPAEPTMFEVEVFNIEAIGIKGGDQCDNIEETQCGIKATDCAGGSDYHCLQNVRVFSKKIQRETQ